MIFEAQGQTSIQRERFRLRVQELENENSQQSQNIAGLSQEIENLRLDNVKLYEKIKFLQNYRPNSGYQVNEYFVLDPRTFSSKTF